MQQAAASAAALAALGTFVWWLVGPRIREFVRSVVTDSIAELSTRVEWMAARQDSLSARQDAVERRLDDLRRETT